MTSLRRLVRLVLRGPGRHASWAEPPRAAQRGAATTVEAWRDGLCASITWQPAKVAGHGTHVYRVSVTRWFQDGDALWRNTANLHAEDLSKLSGLFSECVEKLSTR
jgi:hypothetical protein